LCIYLVNTPFVKVRTFKGDRITGSFNMLVKNVEYNPPEATVEFDNNGTSRLYTSGNDFSIKGSGYGCYEIVFKLENEIFANITGDSAFNAYPRNTNLKFTYINANNWNIADINIKASLEKENDEWKLFVDISHKHLDLDYKTYIAEKISKSFIYKDIVSSDGEIQFGL